jgi:hypothetical protein
LEKRMRKKRLTASLMNYLESSDQHKDVLVEKSKEAREPYVFKTDNLCMIAGDGKSSIIVMKMKECLLKALKKDTIRILF